MLVFGVSGELLQVGEAELDRRVPERPGVRRRQDVGEAHLDFVIELCEAEALSVDEIIKLLLQIRLSE